MTALSKMLNGFIELFYWTLKTIPTRCGSLIRSYAYPFLMKKAGKSFVSENVIITGFKNIEMGNFTTIMCNSYIYANDGTLKIGENCSINNNVQINAAQGNIMIGDNVLIGPNTVIRAGIHNYERCDLPINKQGHRRGKIIIENDVWISSNVVISSDVYIGEGAIIGAASVVTKDVKPYTVVAGNPAAIIKSRK